MSSRTNRVPIQGHATRRDHRVIQTAASASGQTLAAFVVAAAVARAEQCLSAEMVQRIDADFAPDSAGPSRRNR